MYLSIIFAFATISSLFEKKLVQFASGNLFKIGYLSLSCRLSAKWLTARGISDMYTINVRRKHKLFIVFLFFSVFFIFYILNIALSSEWMIYMLDQFPPGTCNSLLRWAPKSQPVIAVLGARGSGVHWARFLIEQMTGIYTGSVNATQYPGVFKAEGVTHKVVSVMMHDFNDLKGIQGVILVYRNMKDTIRTQFAMEQGKGAFLEAPMAAYYGKAWNQFADRKVREWRTTYKKVIDSGTPVLIIGYEELHDPKQLRTQLLRISNYLHVPIRSSVLDCVLEKSQEFPIKPTPLREGFQPFSLLPPSVRKRYEEIEWEVQMLVKLKRDRYMPKVR